MSKGVFFSPSTDRQTARAKVNTVAGFPDFFLQPIIKNRSNILGEEADGNIPTS